MKLKLLLVVLCSIVGFQLSGQSARTAPRSFKKTIKKQTPSKVVPQTKKSRLSTDQKTWPSKKTLSFTNKTIDPQKTPALQQGKDYKKERNDKQHPSLIYTLQQTSRWVKLNAKQ